MSYAELLNVSLRSGTPSSLLATDSVRLVYGLHRVRGVDTGHPHVLQQIIYIQDNQRNFTFATV